jgi:hypothetical protein
MSAEHTCRTHSAPCEIWAGADAPQPQADAHSCCCCHWMASTAPQLVTPADSPAQNTGWAMRCQRARRKLLVCRCARAVYACTYEPGAVVGLNNTAMVWHTALYGQLRRKTSCLHPLFLAFREKKKKESKYALVTRPIHHHVKYVAQPGQPKAQESRTARTPPYSIIVAHRPPPHPSHPPPPYSITLVPPPTHTYTHHTHTHLHTPSLCYPPPPKHPPHPSHCVLSLLFRSH